MKTAVIIALAVAFSLGWMAAEAKYRDPWWVDMALRDDVVELDDRLRRCKMQLAGRPFDQRWIDEMISEGVMPLPPNLAYEEKR